MSEDRHARTLVDEIAEYTLKTGKEISWFHDPLTPGRGRMYLLQHILRNRLLSSVLRPAWMSRCPDPQVVRKTIGQMREELVMDDRLGKHLPNAPLDFRMALDFDRRIYP
jgi:hypothetical protein